MRLIDADALKEHIKQYTIHSGIQASLDRYALYVIEEEPTVDAVPVIRCRECKWNDGGEWVDCFMSGMHGRTSNKNYCSRAERKEG